MNYQSPITLPGVESFDEMRTRHTREWQAGVSALLATTPADHIGKVSGLGAISIIRAFADEHGFKVSDILGSSREKPLAHIRQDCMRAIRKATSLSLPQIGRCLGGRDHTAIKYGIEQSEKRAAT